MSVHRSSSRNELLHCRFQLEIYPYENTVMKPNNRFFPTCIFSASCFGEEKQGYGYLAEEPGLYLLQIRAVEIICDVEYTGTPHIRYGAYGEGILYAHLYVCMN